MIENDKDHHGVQKWSKFVEQWARGTLGGDFPRADDVYT